MINKENISFKFIFMSKKILYKNHNIANIFIMPNIVVFLLKYIKEN